MSRLFPPVSRFFFSPQCFDSSFPPSESTLFLSDSTLFPPVIRIFPPVIRTLFFPSEFTLFFSDSTPPWVDSFLWFDSFFPVSLIFFSAIRLSLFFFSVSQLFPPVSRLVFFQFFESYFKSQPFFSVNWLFFSVSEIFSQWVKSFSNSFIVSTLLHRADSLFPSVDSFPSQYFHSLFSESILFSWVNFCSPVSPILTHMMYVQYPSYCEWKLKMTLMFYVPLHGFSHIELNHAAWTSVWSIDWKWLLLAAPRCTTPGFLKRLRD